jgi:hypothetical protein
LKKVGLHRPLFENPRNPIPKEIYHRIQNPGCSPSTSFFWIVFKSVSLIELGIKAFNRVKVPKR